MAKKVIKRKASDNPYHHPDFHTALNYGIDYLYNSLGKEAVREYLVQFAGAYYSPLKKALRDKGLTAIKEHYEKIYEIENAVFDMHLSDEELIVHLSESPAVMHMKAGGHQVSSVYNETVATVNREICKRTAYDCELVDYNEENGGYKLRFYKRKL
ncbi:MAG TPA: hypothetical protein ENI20_05630 [Bacteroides sp.]|nr:hypothetical protein [Bacteroides sp.]